jgi:hypothetical protein
MKEIERPCSPSLPVFDVVIRSGFFVPAVSAYRNCEGILPVISTCSSARPLASQSERSMP